MEDERKRDVRVGMVPTAEGTWQFVVVADGVWDFIKPIVQSLVVTNAQASGLGTAGEVVKARK
jgi:hypothetical protein